MNISVIDHILNQSPNEIGKELINYYNSHHIILLPLIIGFCIGRFGKSIGNILLIVVVVYIILLYVPLKIPTHFL